MNSVPHAFFKNVGHLLRSYKEIFYCKNLSHLSQLTFPLGPICKQIEKKALSLEFYVAANCDEVYFSMKEEETYLKSVPTDWNRWEVNRISAYGIKDWQYQNRQPLDIQTFNALLKISRNSFCPTGVCFFNGNYNLPKNLILLLRELPRIKTLTSYQIQNEQFGPLTMQAIRRGTLKGICLVSAKVDSEILDHLINWIKTPGFGWFYLRLHSYSALKEDEFYGKIWEAGRYLVKQGKRIKANMNNSRKASYPEFEFSSYSSYSGPLHYAALELL
ncbi:hypothetical protein L596_021999 [Steinernema carpocapsae]|uniref:Uncharacterized protein n=1 Tax=Steinernema carpocapsae TaxID=34508 RepID=A0A4U5MKG1_STECR|nr:hypothetical protein L596_021999 [Steinernema carpocapsae]